MTALPRYALVLASPLPGSLRLGVSLEAGEVSSIDLLPPTHPLTAAGSEQARAIEQQLVGYFRAPAAPIGVPLQPCGTRYQRRVWQALQLIPCGSVATYGEIAAELASSPRAVAAACRANPIPLLIPCHRVVAKGGLGGYMGATDGEALILKQWLLRHEGALRE